MSFPRQAEVEIPLLEVLKEMGGEAKPRDVYPRVALRFPSLSAEEQEERLENYPSIRKWANQVQWVRQRLVERGEVDASVRGVWRLTAAGKTRLDSLKPRRGPVGEVSAFDSPALDLRDLVNTNIERIKSRILSELRSLSPTAFEHFCRELLGHLGFLDVVVTKRSKDGGIDGYGDFRYGAISLRSAFQSKRREAEGSVGRPELDKFRGAMQGEFDHGVFLTTGKFTREAKANSYKKGAITVMLLDGQAIADLLVERGIGVRKLPIYLYDIDDAFFALDDAANP